MSSAQKRQDLGGTDGLSENAVFHRPMESIEGHQVNLASENLCQEAAQSDKVEQADLSTPLQTRPASRHRWLRKLRSGRPSRRDREPGPSMGAISSYVSSTCSTKTSRRPFSSGTGS